MTKVYFIDEDFWEGRKIVSDLLVDDDKVLDYLSDEKYYKIFEEAEEALILTTAGGGKGS